MFNNKVEFIKRAKDITPESIDYIPRIKDANPIIEPDKLKFGKDKLYKVIEVLDDGSLKLDTGLVVKFRGAVIKDLKSTLFYAL